MYCIVLPINRQLKLTVVGGGELGPRNDVLTTCKTFTLSDGQRIILQYFEKRTSRENNSIIQKLISCLFVFLVYYICPLVLNWIAKRKRHSLQPCKFLTDNNAYWTIYRVYGYFAERGEDYRSYDADKNYWRMCQIYRNYVYSAVLHKYELTHLNRQIHTS